MLLTFKKGVHPKDCKELSKDRPIAVMDEPAVVYIALAQHIGKPCTPVVKPGDTVKRGELIAKPQGLGANIFSSVSGMVKEISDRATPTGKCQHIVIEKDDSKGEFRLPPLLNPTAQDIVRRAEDAGIVGMGGAGFPLSVKLSPKTDVDTFIINAAECEPYITCDYRIMKEMTREFVLGAGMLGKAVGVKNIVIGIEENKSDVVSAIEDAIFSVKSDARVEVLKTKYPQGAEKQLIYAVTKRRVPLNKLPSDVGCLVGNVHTALSLYYAVTEGMTLYKRVMTVSGRGIKNPSNLWVSTGTPYKDVIEFCGGLSHQSTVKLLSGGPMMGFGLLNDESVTTKTAGALLLLTSDEAFTGLPSACINCGKCARACPMNLMPMYIDAYALVGDTANAEKYGALSCIECGCCAYTCPAKRPLVQSIRLAKKKLRESK